MIKLQEIREAFLHMLFPHVCAGCGNDIISSKNILCLTCLHAMPETQFQFFQSNPVEKNFWGRLSIQAATAQYYFTKESLMQILLHELKYKGNRALGIYLGRLMGEQIIQSERFAGLEALIPLPLYASRERKRGYNQSALLCRGMAEVMMIPVIHDAISRNKFTDSQTKKGRIERWKNMEGKFEIMNGDAISDRHILLVDDVITTGATMEACGTELLSVPGVDLSLASLCYASH
ncbi:MAG: ComF family protein [Chitinophagaceae bacterium]|jgi:ComF family protein|nr:ComF family protein [Chitinophagaceae bacterium]